MLKIVDFSVWIDDKRFCVLDGSGRFGFVHATIPVGSVVYVPGPQQAIRSLADTMAEGEFYFMLYREQMDLLLKYAPNNLMPGARNRYKPTIKMETLLKGELVHQFHNCFVESVGERPLFLTEDKMGQVNISFYGYEGVMVPKEDAGECYEP